MSLPPSEVPQGAIRFNTDSQKLEFYAQGEWWVMSTDTPNLAETGDSTPGARGLIGGGGFNVPTTTYRDSIEYVNISSTGNAREFGDLNVARYYIGATASSTRAVFNGGQYSGGTEKTMEFVTISSTGTVTNFGEDHADLAHNAAGCGNQTRGLFGSGFAPGPFTPNNVIEYITIASTGNANDFGDLVTTSAQRGAFSSPVRGVWCGGYHPGNPFGQIDFVNIASTGNAQSFGELTITQIRVGGGSNATRGVYFAGQTSPSPTGRTGNINYVTIATGGNAVYFGDLLSATEWPRMMSNSTRGVVAGGSPGPYIGTHVTMEQLNFSTQGNTVGFGDLNEGRTFGPGATSNAHGGL